MLASLPNIDGLVTKEIVIESLHQCVSISTGGVWGRFAKLIKISHTTVQGWYKEKVKIPLSNLLRICYCLNLSITAFLRGTLAVSGNGSSLRELPDIPCLAEVTRICRILDYEKIRLELASFLDQSPPISFAEASRRLKIDSSDLHRRFPELCVEISARYKKYRQDFYKSKRTEFEDEVRQAVIHLYAQGIYVSPRPVAKYLNKPSYYARRDVAAIIRKTREELDIEKGPLGVN
ncbi:MAG TPA: helix-turn-helix transcriptional regulator [Pyrinomonadaceae bacterium]